MRPLTSDLGVRFCRALDRGLSARAAGAASRRAGRGVLRHAVAVPQTLRQDV